jgi:DNA-directed RNA polymerase subunit RPC12/RpoP
MIGRYGPDQLNVALLIFAIVLGMVGSIIGLGVVTILSYIPLAYAFFRMFSRNIPGRRAENDRFLRFWWPVKTKISGKIRQFKDRKTHKFFKCPSCGNTLRVPKGKGKIQITCPKCGERFIKKT